MSAVHLERAAPGVRLLRVERPERRNALNWQAQAEFAGALYEAARDIEAKALIITGSGPAFLSGGDLTELNEFSEREDGLRLSLVMGDALADLWNAGILSLAAINGPARGGGAEVAMWCDLRWMAADADIAFVHSNLGLTPGWGGRRRLEEVVGKSRAAELLTSGRVVGAEEAARIGLANQVAGREALLPSALEYVQRVSADPESRGSRGRAWLPTRKALLTERTKFLRRWDSELRRQKFRMFLER